jgi:hypothetical protein
MYSPAAIAPGTLDAQAHAGPLPVVRVDYLQGPAHPGAAISGRSPNAAATSPAQALTPPYVRTARRIAASTSALVTPCRAERSLTNNAWAQRADGVDAAPAAAFGGHVLSIRGAQMDICCGHDLVPSDLIESARFASIGE